jgi:hypothetical protein
VQVVKFGSSINETLRLGPMSLEIDSKQSTIGCNAFVLVYSLCNDFERFILNKDSLGSLYIFS